jgi:hypothetical protein
VKNPCRYEPDLNRTYLDFANHYGTAVIPTRVNKPKDNSKAEVGVQVVERWVLAAIRNRTFFGLEELNTSIRELTEQLNNRRFKKLLTSRRELFEKLDQPALKPLPSERYSFVDWKTARVGIDYHIEVGRHFYSVPCQLTGEQVDVRLGPQCWKLADPTLADAILDRLVHNAYKIELRGESMRKLLSKLD